MSNTTENIKMFAGYIHIRLPHAYLPMYSTLNCFACPSTTAVAVRTGRPLLAAALAAWLAAAAACCSPASPRCRKSTYKSSSSSKSNMKITNSNLPSCSTMQPPQRLLCGLCASDCRYRATSHLGHDLRAWEHSPEQPQSTAFTTKVMQANT
jgi:hypothetical protein